MNIGKIERVPLREIWKHEAHDFTTWLQDNIDVLNDVLDLNLHNAEREQAAGAFSVDIVAEDNNGDTVVIENQLEKSDHDHLGKLITYLAVQDAKTAIWIVAEPRPEHTAAINWLNELSGASFYLLKIEAVRIGGSEPALLVTEIVGPSEELRQAGEVKKDLLERHILRRQFWTGLLERASSQTQLHSNISPTQENWISAGAGISGVGFNYVVRQHDARVELYMSKSDSSQNESIFDKLFQNKEDIESIFGDYLNWQRLDERTSCRISYEINVGGYRNNTDMWNDIYDAMVNKMIKLEKTMSPFLREIR